MREAVRILILLVLAGSGQAGQQPEIRVDVEAVNLQVTVVDRRGSFVTDLTQDRFRVFEDRVEQEITNFQHLTDLPLRIGLLFDSSSSVRLQLDFQKQAATEFIYSVLTPQDRALLAEFDSGVALLQDFTSRPSELARAIRGLRAGGGTALFDAVYTVSRDKMVENDARKAFIIISDGDDVSSRRTEEETLTMVLQSGVIVYAIGTTRYGASPERRGERVLKRLAEQTGGRAFFPATSEELREAFDLVNTELRSQYNLAYVSSNDKRDGKFREIEVKLDQGRGLTLRHRRGYFSPLDAGS